MEKHDLLHEFPEHRERIHELKTSDNHFRRLFDEYHHVNDDVQRIESGAENSDDDTLTKLRLERLRLKDELHGILTK